MKINSLCYTLSGLILATSLFFTRPLLMGLLLINLLTLVIYGADKLAARKSWQRVPENTLLLFGLLGGWAGALVGQHLFRHKTQKQPFRTWFLLSIVLNIVVMLLAGYWMYWR